jgi:ubiquinone/menaquinone biosynthesis C-methylase UbiE
MRALELPAQAVEDALLSLIPPGPGGRLLDIGTGTGRVLELLAPRVRQALGVDASKAMLALARARLSAPEFAHCAVRLADMYRLPLADQSFETVVLQMVLHHAEDPAGAVREAARVLTGGGRLLVIDLAEHQRTDLTGKLAHRWAGFSDVAINEMFTASGIAWGEPIAVPGPLPIRIWPATRVAAAAPVTTLERAY